MSDSIARIQGGQNFIFSGVPSYYNYVCLSGLWLGGLLYLSFLTYFFKLVCYAHVFPCTCLTLLTSFFLPSHLSFKNMYDIVYEHYAHVHGNIMHMYMETTTALSNLVRVYKPVVPKVCMLYCTDET